jgi:hypothetical protein
MGGDADIARRSPGDFWRVGIAVLGILIGGWGVILSWVAMAIAGAAVVLLAVLSSNTE